jgi:hypothetical protein
VSEQVPDVASNLGGGVSCQATGVCVAVGQWLSPAGGASADGPYILLN